ncbi:MAG: 23S rRNA (pseudouridine(1915)-N(3))-methyltransferase RlmH [Pseudomonadota bacterium]
MAVGEQKSGPEKALTEDYSQRFGKTARNLGMTGINLVTVKSGGGASREADRLLSKIPANAAIMRLDEHGKSLSSMKLAEHISRLRDQGTREIVFLIGGAEGFSEEISSTYPQTLALGPQTWPHLLVRAMLAEQLYRAATILAGSPYHKA